MTCELISKGQSIIQEVIEKFSSATKIERVLAYILRFISNSNKQSPNRTGGQLSLAEVQDAHLRIIKHIQAIQLAAEISDLQTKQQLKTSNPLCYLHPFIDEHGILRVEGRLLHASLPFEQKHPIILPATNRFVKLLFERKHRRLLHASQLLLLSSVRKRYWSLRGIWQDKFAICASDV